jgi:predicted enzyme related to lactoylglutathione lyase
MLEHMTVLRIVPNLSTTDAGRAQRFYAEVLGLTTAMDHGWIVTVAGSSDSRSQLSLLTHDATAPVVAEVSIEVDDVDAAHDAAVAWGAAIVHPLTDEAWGVRRFCVLDPDGHVLNVLSHR